MAPRPPPKEKSNGDGLPVVLITGCSSGGIGFELAGALARSGKARVVATARDVSKMSELLSHKEGVLALVPLDVSDDRSFEEASRRVLELTGGRGCDVLVNNAGVTFKGTLLDADVDATSKLFDCNVMGTLRAIKAFSPGMVRRGRGLIVNVGSATGYIHQATKSAYSASKHAVKSLTDTLRIELSPFNCRVILVSPGYVGTGIDEKAGEQGRWFAPVAGESPYAASGDDAADGGGFREINAATRSSIFKVGPGASCSMPPSTFSSKLAETMLREWDRTSPAKGLVTRPPTMKEYLLSSAWLPTILGGPVRHYRDAPYSNVTWLIGGFCPLWLQDFLMSLSGGLIQRL